MTKYERARILSTRALQISMNAPVMVELEGGTYPLEVEALERVYTDCPKPTSARRQQLLFLGTQVTLKVLLHCHVCLPPTLCLIPQL
ncbi:hypothetical protein DAI22_08g158200 [Oryza sativa Japonica Group]|nr:hypothetical protein DAI22_08g158200 [Oryza sativa Japonica Group]